MKKLFILPLLAAAMLFTGCKNDREQELNGETVFTVNFQAPRRDAGAPADCQVTQFVLQIEDLTTSETKQVVNEVNAGITTTSFNAKLVFGHTYNFLFWADTKGTYDVTDLNAVTIDPAEYVGNDPKREAFCYALMNKEVKSQFTMDVILTRPFAQLNIITTDLNSAADVDVTAGMVLTFTAPSTYNVATGEATDPVEFTSTTTALYGITADGQTPVTMDYILAPADDKELIDLTYIANGLMDEARIFSAVPVQRNYRTNLIGDLFSMNSVFNVNLDQNWGDTQIINDAFVTVYSAEQLKTAVNGTNAIVNINLGADINLTDILTTNANATDIVIEGNGHAISGAYIYLNSANVTFSNVVFKNAYATDGTTPSCVYATNHKVNNLIFKGCTFMDHSWDCVQAIDETIESIEFDHCTFNAENAYKRYIHIEIPASNTTAMVTITNCEFYNVDKADDSAITLYGVMHSNMTIADNIVYGNGIVNSDMFWISDGRTMTVYSDTELATMFTESALPVRVASQDELNAAVAAAVAGDVISLAAGTYSIPNIPQNITLRADANVKYNCEGSGSIASVSNGATFEGGEFTFGNNNYHGFQHAGTINMKGCTLNGKFFSYGEMNFDGCTFIQNTADYHMWMYGTTVTYNDCTFKGQGKFINVYSEGNASVLKIVCNDCYFESSVSNKAALNIKETCGATLLRIEAEINNCTTNENFPAAVTSETLYVASSVWQVDDRTANHADSDVKVTVDGEVKYVNGQPVL
ncbi:MAG: hypothetical protein MJZ82_00460 [Paludibacteraceae bacterium]|nr:hypothetical protein [Paludibacteraceae bacterium]